MTSVPISRISLHVPETQRPLWATALLLFLGFLVLFVATSLFNLWVANRELIAWWYQGSKNQPYHRYMSIWLVLAQSAQGLTALLLLLQVFYSRNTTLTTAQANFMRQKLFPLRRRTDAKAEQVGILTPDQLCDSVLLYADDQDLAFDAWLETASPKRRAGTRRDKDDPAKSAPLTFEAIQPSTTAQGLSYWDYTGHAQPLKGEAAAEVFGVFPSYRVAGFVDWRGCIQSWANGGLARARAEGASSFAAPLRSHWVWMQNGGPPGAPGADMLVLKDLLGQEDESAWWDIEAQPDNFLARYGVRMNSPLVIAFVNQKAYFEGVSYDIDATAFSNLVGANESGSSAGGWVGLLKGFSDEKTSDDFQNLVFRSVDLNASTAPPIPCNVGFNMAIAGSSSFFSGALASLLMLPSDAARAALAAGESGVFGVWGGFAAAVALVAVSVGLTLGQAANSCG